MASYFQVDIKILQGKKVKRKYKLCIHTPKLVVYRKNVTDLKIKEEFYTT
jgi:hypothetical protein